MTHSQDQDTNIVARRIYLSRHPCPRCPGHTSVIILEHMGYEEYDSSVALALTLNYNVPVRGRQAQDYGENVRQDVSVRPIAVPLVGPFVTDNMRDRWSQMDEKFAKSKTKPYQLAIEALEPAQEMTESKMAEIEEIMDSEEFPAAIKSIKNHGCSDKKNPVTFVLSYMYKQYSYCLY